MIILFKEFFVFTDSGLCLYSWKSPSISQSTDSNLIGGLLFAVSEFAKQAFRGRLQRLDLDNSKLIMTAHEFEVTKKGDGAESKTLIFGALVDSRDNNSLIQELLFQIGQEISEHIDPSGIKPMENKIIDPIINNLLNKRAFSRKMPYTILGILISAFGIFMGSLSISLDWSHFIDTSLLGIFDVAPVILFTFGLVFLGSIFIGERVLAIKTTMLVNLPFSIFLFYLFEDYLSQIQYLTGLGQFPIYFIFIVLITFSSSLFGGLFTERKYLFPDQ